MKLSRGKDKKHAKLTPNVDSGFVSIYTHTKYVEERKHTTKKMHTNIHKHKYCFTRIESQRQSHDVSRTYSDATRHLEMTITAQNVSASTLPQSMLRTNPYNV